MIGKIIQNTSSGGKYTMACWSHNALWKHRPENGKSKLMFLLSCWSWWFSGEELKSSSVFHLPPCHPEQGMPSGKLGRADAVLLLSLKPAKFAGARSRRACRSSDDFWLLACWRTMGRMPAGNESRMREQGTGMSSDHVCPVFFGCWGRATREDMSVKAAWQRGLLPPAQKLLVSQEPASPASRQTVHLG